MSGRENESPYRALIASLNSDLFLISIYHAHSSGVRRRIVLRGTICPFCFRTHWVILFPSFLAGPRQRPSTCAGNGNFSVVSRKYTHTSLTEKTLKNPQDKDDNDDLPFDEVSPSIPEADIIDDQGRPLHPSLSADLLMNAEVLLP